MPIERVEGELETVSAHVENQSGKRANWLNRLNRRDHL
jgi:hypothetical protein